MKNLGNFKLKKKSKKQIRAERKQHLKEWAVFLKDDYDWDYFHILNMLKYKLERTRKCIQKNSIIVKNERDTIEKEIKEVEGLLQKVMDDDYFAKYEKELTKKYGKMNHEDKKLPDGNTQWIMYRDKETKENEKAMSEETRKAYQSAEQDKVSDLKLAFNIIAEKCWGWWD